MPALLVSFFTQHGGFCQADEFFALFECGRNRGSVVLEDRKIARSVEQDSGDRRRTGILNELGDNN